MGLIDKDVFVCIDCETTGLDPSEDRIIEIAATIFRLDGVIDTFDTLIDPERPIAPDSIEIHNITDAMVVGQPVIEDILPGFLKFIQSYPIVGHGVNFDIEIIAAAAKRASIPCRIQETSVLDTLRLARLYGDSRKNSLEELRKHFNIASEGAHRALSDVIVNIEVFKHLIKGFNKTEDALERLQKPIKLKTMPLGKHKGRPFSEIPHQYLVWAANKDFDQDLLFTIRSELKRRKRGGGFAQSVNPFQNL